MTDAKVTDRHSFNDGKILLYKLENRPRKLWLCRIKVPNGTGYLYRGTGTSDLYEARRFADALLDELRLKIRLGQSITGLSFRQIVDEYEAAIHASDRVDPRQEAILAFLKSYAVPYFLRKKTAAINETEIARFFDWRRQNGVRKVPSETTILHETSQFNSFLKWCHKRGLLDRRIVLDRPKHRINRRPHFDQRDWRKLTRFLREWVKQGRHKSGPIYRDRVMLTNYVLILANTGIRVGEARGLRWKDIDSETNETGKTIDIILHVKGKTGTREVVARTVEVRTWLERIWSLRCEECNSKPSRDEAIFCHKDGKPIHSFKSGFMRLLEEAGVTLDRNGDRRTIYSLRHTYATFRLQEGVNHYALARNMGTSVRMLEQFYGHVSNRAMASELTKSRQRDRPKMPWE